MGDLTEHFDLSEFHLPPGVTDDIVSKCTILASRYLEPIRALFGQPIVITDSYRAPDHNAAVGGVATSYHLFQGDHSAVDFFVENTATDKAFHAILAAPVMAGIDKIILEAQTPAKLAVKDWSMAVIHLQVSSTPRCLAYYGCTAGQSGYTAVPVPPAGTEGV